MTDLLKIPFQELPKGVMLCLNNSDRHREDAKVLYEKNRIQSAIVSLIISIEEVGKALWLTYRLKKCCSIIEPRNKSAFTSHKEKIKIFFEFIDGFSDYTRSNGINNFVNMVDSIPNDQEYKLRMIYVDYDEANRDEYYEVDAWKDPNYIARLAFIGDFDSNIALKTKYNELVKDLEFGISKFRNMPIYDTILSIPPNRVPPAAQVLTFVKKHFLLDSVQNTIGTNEKTIELTIQPRGKQNQYITEKLRDTIYNDLHKNYPFAKIIVKIIPKQSIK